MHEVVCHFLFLCSSVSLDTLITLRGTSKYYNTNIFVVILYYFNAFDSRTIQMCM